MKQTDKLLLSTCLISIILTSVAIVIGVILYFSYDTEKNAPKAECKCSEIAVVEREEVTAEPEPEPIEVETVSTEPEMPYFIEVNGNYISEASLDSVCNYLGSAYRIPPNLLKAVAWTESNFKVNAKGSAGDSGLCQIIPKYHKQRMSKLGVTDLMDPYSNLLVAADLLSELRDSSYVGEDWGYIIMCYNQGGTARKTYQSKGLSSHAKKVMNKYYEFSGGNV